MAGDVETLVTRVGDLPDAPLAMPKQRLETPGSGVAGIIGRLIGRTPAVAGEARPGGR